MNEPRVILGAWALKKQGFPQPEIQDGQVWVSLHDHVHQIKGSPFGLVTEQLDRCRFQKYRFFDGVVTEGMAYCPTKSELEQFLNERKNEL